MPKPAEARKPPLDEETLVRRRETSQWFAWDPLGNGQLDAALRIVTSPPRQQCTATVYRPNWGGYLVHNVAHTALSLSQNARAGRDRTPSWCTTGSPESPRRTRLNSLPELRPPMLEPEVRAFYTRHHRAPRLAMHFAPHTRKSATYLPDPATPTVWHAVVRHRHLA